MLGARDWLFVREIPLFLIDLPPEFEGYRIAQFSDLHFGGSTTLARLRDLVARINARQPDLIAFTGDFVTMGSHVRIGDLVASLRDLCARDAKLAVMGNHDYLGNTRRIQRLMRRSGMIDLDNAVYSVRRGDACLHFAGVGSLTRRRARLDLVMQQLPETGIAFLLAHEPEFISVSAATERFILQLSGHTHGGQVRLPLVTRLALNGETRRFLHGGYFVDGRLLYVNQGIGTVGLPLRINCPSELTIFTLRMPAPPGSSPSRPA